MTDLLDLALRPGGFHGRHDGQCASWALDQGRHATQRAAWEAPSRVND